MSISDRLSAPSPPPRPALDAGSLFGRRATCCAAVAVVVLYAAGVSRHWYLSPDGALYLMLGRSLAEGNGYTLFGRPHYFVPPGFPFLLAGMMRAGIESMVWFNLAMALIGLATIWFAYRLVREHVTHDAAMLVTLIVAFSWAMYHHSLRQLSDVPFMMFVCAGLYCYVRGVRQRGPWLELGTAALIASCLMRVLGAPLVIGAAAGLALSPGTLAPRRARVNALAASSLTAFLGAYSYFYLQSHLARESVPVASYALYFDHMASQRTVWWLVGPLRNFFASNSALAELLSGQGAPQAVALCLFGVPTLVGLGIGLRRRQWIAAFAATAYIGAILLLRAMIPRYLLPVAPLLCLYFLVGVWTLAAWRPKLQARAPQIVAGCAAVLIVANLPKDAKLIYWMHRSDMRSYRREWPPIYEVSEVLKTHTDAADRLICLGDSPRPFAYLAGVAYVPLGNGTSDQVTRDEIMGQLNHEGVTTVIVGPGRKSRYFKRVCDTVRTNGAFRMVFHNDRYEVWQRPQAGAPNTAVAADAGPHTEPTEPRRVTRLP